MKQTKNWELIEDHLEATQKALSNRTPSRNLESLKFFMRCLDYDLTAVREQIKTLEGGRSDGTSKI